jgi:hypothetical protein
VSVALNSRYFRLLDLDTKDPEKLHQRVNDLCHVVQSMAQELATLKGMLELRGLWDESEYKRLRTDRMIADHNGTGPSPWTAYSIYPHTRDEDDFLRAELAADESDLHEFRRRAKVVAGLT